MSAFTSLHYHIVFGTKARKPILTPDVRLELFPYVCGILKAKDAHALAVGGIEDHVHLLVRLRQDHTIASAVRDLKSNSSAWMRRRFPDLDFSWQVGYGAFTVGINALLQVKGYITNQEKHHEGRTFEEEFRGFLKTHGIDYDPRYMW